MTIDNRPLDQRLNALDNVTQELDQVTKTIDPNETIDATLEQSVPYTTQGDLISDETTSLPEQTDPVFTGEKIDTAGLRDIGVKVLKKITTKTPKDAVSDLAVPIVKEGKAIEKAGQFTIIPEAPKKTTQKVMQQIEVPSASGEIDKMLFDPTAPLDFNNLGQAVTNVYELGKYKKLSYKEIVERNTTPKAFITDNGVTVKEFETKELADKWVASQPNAEQLTVSVEPIYDEKFLARMLDANGQTIADPNEIAKLPYIARSIQDKNISLYRNYLEAKAKDPESIETKDLAAKFALGLNLEGNFMGSVTGKRRDIARSLGVLREAYKASGTSPERALMLDSILNGSGGLDNIDDIGKHYIALNSRLDRAALAEKTLFSSAKDVWYATWVNGLLSSPITHAKNIAGNALFGMWQVPENFVASVLGKGRSVLTGNKDYIQMNEVMDKASAMSMSLSDAFRLGVKAFQTNTPSDPLTKLEMRTAGRDDFNLNFGDSTFGKAMSDGVKYYGNFITLPGRALMAEDEFFKAIGYRGELGALARRESNKKYNELIGSGVDPDVARKKVTNYHASLLENPTDEMHELATKEARTMTFTAELEGSLRLANKAINTEFLGFPYAKLFFPFVRTPANIIKETLSRSPLALPSAIHTAVKTGGIEGDKALAKLTLGSAAMWTMHQYTLGGNLTGAGPVRRKDLEALKGTGWQPFSMVFNKSDVDQELVDKFSEITNVTVGADKIYISYESLGPLASLLGMASTSAEYAMLDPEEEGLDRLAMNGAVGLYDYMSNLDMLQGIGDIHDMFSSDAQSAPEKFYAIASKFTKKSIDVGIGGSPAGAYSSLSATYERYSNPEKSNLMREETSLRSEASAVYDGYWQALAQYKSRNPLLSDSLPVALDPLTGETKKVGKGNFYETFSPFKRSDGTNIEGYLTLVEYGVPAYIPQKSKDGVMLSGEQYNRWIEIATNDGALEKRVVKLGELYKSIKGMDMSVAQKAIQKEISDTYGLAWDRLVQEDVDLQMALEDMKEVQKETGIYTR